MPSFETPEKELHNASSSEKNPENEVVPKRKSQASREGHNEYEEDWRKKEALEFLSATGRAKNPEEAERYLESVNRIKEKLLLLVQSLVAENENADWSRGASRPEVWAGGHALTMKGLANFTERGIDHADPQLWELSRHIDPDYRSYLPDKVSHLGTTVAGRDQLMISAEGGATITIEPDFEGFGEELARELEKHLSKDEFEFLKQEYMHAAGDLEKQVRAVADSVATQRARGEFPPLLSGFSSSDRQK